MSEVQKHGIGTPVGDRIRADVDAVVKRLAGASPEQRAQWEREAAERRAEIRRTQCLMDESDAAIIAGVAEHFATYAYGNFWTPDYIRHLAQPYCDCEWDSDGAWNLCEHARDLGFG